MALFRPTSKMALGLPGIMGGIYRGIGVFASVLQEEMDLTEPTLRIFFMGKKPRIWAYPCCNKRQNRPFMHEVYKSK